MDNAPSEASSNDELTKVEIQLILSEINRVRDLSESYVSQARNLPLTIGTVALSSVVTTFTVLQLVPAFLSMAVAVLIAVYALVTHALLYRLGIATWAWVRLAELEAKLHIRSIHTDSVLERTSAMTASCDIPLSSRFMAMGSTKDERLVFGVGWTFLAFVVTWVMGLVEAGLGVAEVMVFKLLTVTIPVGIVLGILFWAVWILVFWELYRAQVRMNLPQLQKVLAKYPNRDLR